MSNQSAEHALAKRFFAAELSRLMKTHNVTPIAIQKISNRLVFDGKLKEGVHAESVYQYKAGNTMPRRAKLEAIAAVLEVSVESLVPPGYMAPEARLSRALGRRVQRENVIEVTPTKDPRVACLHVNLLLGPLPPEKAEKAAELLKAFFARLKEEEPK